MKHLKKFANNFGIYINSGCCISCNNSNANLNILSGAPKLKGKNENWGAKPPRFYYFLRFNNDFVIKSKYYRSHSHVLLLTEILSFQGVIIFLLPPDFQLNKGREDLVGTMNWGVSADDIELKIILEHDYRCLLQITPMIKSSLSPDVLACLQKYFTSAGVTLT